MFGIQWLKPGATPQESAQLGFTDHETRIINRLRVHLGPGVGLDSYEFPIHSSEE